MIRLIRHDMTWFLAISVAVANSVAVAVAVAAAKGFELLQALK